MKVRMLLFQSNESSVTVIMAISRSIWSAIFGSLIIPWIPNLDGPSSIVQIRKTIIAVVTKTWVWNYVQLIFSENGLLIWFQWLDNYLCLEHQICHLLVCNMPRYPNNIQPLFSRMPQQQRPKPRTTRRRTSSWWMLSYSRSTKFTKFDKAYKAALGDYVFLRHMQFLSYFIKIYNFILGIQDVTYLRRKYSKIYQEF